MALNLVTLNVRGLRDPSKYAHLLGKLLNLSCCRARDLLLLRCGLRVLEDDYVVLLAYGSCSSVEVSLLIGCSLNADVNLILADDGGQLVVADVAVRRFEFWMPAVYAHKIAVERVSILWLASFLNDPKRLVLVGDWNAILDPKTGRVGRGARGSERCESYLIDLMASDDLVDRFSQDYPGREMWTSLDSSPSVRARSYLDRVLVRRADTDFVTGHTFLYVTHTDHRLVRVSLRLADRSSLAGYWKFNTS